MKLVANMLYIYIFFFFYFYKRLVFVVVKSRQVEHYIGKAGLSLNDDLFGHKMRHLNVKTFSELLGHVRQILYG
jgi:hypothetical protein